MSYEVAQHFPKDMIFKEDSPLVSLYLPTHRSYPDNKQDTIVYKNLLRTIENSLEVLSDNEAGDSIMKSLHEIQEDKEFWNHTSDGIAVFASANKCIVYNLHNSVTALAVVADSFHISPLIKSFQSMENYQILGLSRECFTLYQGNRNGFEEIVIAKDVPRTMEEVLGAQLSEPHLTHGSHAGAGGGTMYHGHGDVKQEIDKDTDKYFRYVDAFVLDNYSKISEWPLILVALSEYHSHFKKISNNPYLLDVGINKSSESIDLDEVKVQVITIIDTINMDKKQKLVESFAEAEAKQLGSSDVGKVAKAAAEGRVETILVEEDKLVPGKIDDKTGKIKSGEYSHPDTDDVLDDLAELVLSNGGTVHVMAKDTMPGATGVAAIYRY